MIKYFNMDYQNNNKVDNNLLLKTVKKVLKSPTFRQLLAVSALSLGCFLDGIVLAYSSPALPSIEKVVRNIRFYNDFVSINLNV